jgi:hypothetical protein
MKKEMAEDVPIGLEKGAVHDKITTWWIIYQQAEKQDSVMAWKTIYSREQA